MKINFNKPLVDLAGKKIEDSMGTILSQALSQLSKGESIKIWTWCVALFKGESLDLDQTDFKVLRGLIETLESLTILSKAQMLTIMDEAEAQERSKKK